MRLATLGCLKLPSHSIRLMAGVLREQRLDVGGALKAAGLTPAMLGDPSHQVTGKQELAFQRAFFELTRDQPLVWIELGTRYRLISHAPECYYLMLVTSPNMEIAVQKGLRFGELYYTLAYGTGIFTGERLVGYRQFATEVPNDMKRFSALRDMGMNCAVFEDLWGGPFPFDSVELPVPVSDDPFVRRFIPFAPIVYDADHSVRRWSVRLDERPAPQSDPVLHDFYARKCEAMIEAAREADGILGRVTSLLTETQGRLSLGEAAREVGLSARTLQRRLDERGVTFRDLAVLGRHYAACRMLVETKHTIERIALDVGYENLSSFCHAFKRQSGISPRDYRREKLMAS